MEHPITRLGPMSKRDQDAGNKCSGELPGKFQPYATLFAIIDGKPEDCPLPKLHYEDFGGDVIMEIYPDG